MNIFIIKSFNEINFSESAEERESQRQPENQEIPLGTPSDYQLSVIEGCLQLIQSNLLLSFFSIFLWMRDLLLLNCLSFSLSGRWQFFYFFFLLSIITFNIKITNWSLEMILIAGFINFLTVGIHISQSDNSFQNFRLETFLANFTSVKDSLAGSFSTSNINLLHSVGGIETT